MTSFIKTRSWLSLAALALVACGSDAADDGDETVDSLEGITYNLEAEGGDVDEADEPDLAAALDLDFDEGDDAADTTAEPADVTEQVNNKKARVYAVRLLWGKLSPVPDAPMVDYSGEVSVSVGAIKAVRRLRFDGQDHIVRPRTDPKTLAFVSQVGPHYDGLVLRVVDVDRPSDDAAQAHTLTIKLGETELTYDMSELENLVDVHGPDANGNRLLVQALRRGGDTCDNGFLGGRWRRVDERGGKLGGHWMGPDGRANGFLMGVWGERADGSKVMYAKYVGRDGGFKGRIEGTYAPGVDGGFGTFEGTWLGRAGVLEGTLSGQYVEGEGRGKGFFRGRFDHNACTEPVTQE